MKYKVIFDTNQIDNSLKGADSLSGFFGQRSMLESYASISHIIIPDMVMDEIAKHIKEEVKKHRSRFKDSIFYSLHCKGKKSIEKSIDNFDADLFVSELRKKESIQHEIISLSNQPAALERIKNMCLSGELPFSNKEDKGFKDAYIFLTIKEYKMSNPNETILFVSGDGLLKDAILNLGIHVVNSIKEFKDKVVEEEKDHFLGEYFVETLKAKIGEESIDHNNIDGKWINAKNNFVLKIKLSDGNLIFVEIDYFSKEILNYTKENFSAIIKELRGIKSINKINDSVEELTGYLHYFDKNQIESLLSAASENRLILSLVDNDLVRDFFTDLYGAGIDFMLNDNVVKNFKKKFLSQKR